VRLPDLVIIGAPRCGTSSLWAMLKALPGARTPRIKEAHFFNRKWGRGLRWYAGFFSGAGDTNLCFEATPAYLAAPKAAERAADALPETRFVVMLRDPVARAISHYWPNKHLCLVDMQNTLSAGTAISSGRGYSSLYRSSSLRARSARQGGCCCTSGDSTWCHIYVQRTTIR